MRRQTDRNTDRQARTVQLTDRLTVRETDRNTDRQTRTQTARHGAEGDPSLSTTLINTSHAGEFWGHPSKLKHSPM